MNDELIRYVTGEYDVEIVRRLCVPNGNLMKISGLERCTQIVSLSLPENRIESIGHGLECLTQLQRLDLSKNLLTGLLGLAHLDKLAFLNVQGNLIEKLDEVARLENNPAMVHLHLQSYDGARKNPCCEHHEYDSFIRQKLPKLQVLDGERLALRKHRDNLDRLIQGIRPDPEFLTPLKPTNWLDDDEDLLRYDEQLKTQLNLLKEECASPSS